MSRHNDNGAYRPNRVEIIGFVENAADGQLRRHRRESRKCGSLSIPRSFDYFLIWRMLTNR
jgi:hypothetical protein